MPESTNPGLGTDRRSVGRAARRWLARFGPGTEADARWWTRWTLREHKNALLDTSGNAGPTIWADGRSVGGWATRANGEVVTKLLDDLGRETKAAIDAEAGRLTAWLPRVSVIPRFPTPLHREVVG